MKKLKRKINPKLTVVVMIDALFAETTLSLMSRMAPSFREVSLTEVYEMMAEGRIALKDTDDPLGAAEDFFWMELLAHEATSAALKLNGVGDKAILEGRAELADIMHYLGSTIEKAALEQIVRDADFEPSTGLGAVFAL